MLGTTILQAWWKVDVTDVILYDDLKFVLGRGNAQIRDYEEHTVNSSREAR